MRTIRPREALKMKSDKPIPSILTAAALLMTTVATTSLAAPVKPGDVIDKNNVAVAADVLSPGNFILVQQGMQIHVVPTDKLDWPPPYKTASEKYASQVSLGSDGEIKGFVAGQPFPLLDPND